MTARADDCLVELGCEELPADYLPEAMRALAERAAEALAADAGFTWDRIEVWATPRRLTLLVRELAPIVRWQKVGPPKSAAYDAQGQPTPAATGFAKSQGVPVSALTIAETPRGACIAAVHAVPVIPKLTEAIPAVVKALRFPKQMRWGTTGITFARPIRWVVALYGARVVPARVAELTAGRRTCGPRRTGGRWVTIPTAAGYFTVLRRAGVVLEQRWEPVTQGGSAPAPHAAPPKAAALARQLDRAARGLKGRLDDGEEFAGLLTTVSFLAECPVVQVGAFRKEYLTLPAEVLATAMAKHLKAFNLRDGQGRLLPKFLVVLEGRPTRPAVVLANYERIVEARFTDAQFFWREDTKTPLAEKTSQLRGVVFHKLLGTLDDKAVRLATLAHRLGVADAALARAIHLAKADLVTQLVKEYPTLQGIVGAEYARHDGEPPAVAQALREQYLPRTATDEVPATSTGAWLSLLDRLDTLTGSFGVGLAPTSSKDPYGLRRQALGFVRILLAPPTGLSFLGVSIDSLIDEGIQSWGSTLTVAPAAIHRDLKAFVRERFVWWLRGQGMDAAVLEAVLAAEATDLAGAKARGDLLQSWWRARASARGALLVQAAKVAERTSRIVAGVDSAQIPEAVQAEALTEPTERALWTAWQAVQPQVVEALAHRQYETAVRAYSTLAPSVHAFFEQVFVMDERPEVRRNRLALLRQIARALGTHFADIAKLPLAGMESS